MVLNKTALMRFKVMSFTLNVIVREPMWWPVIDYLHKAHFHSAVVSFRRVIITDIIA